MTLTSAFNLLLRSDMRCARLMLAMGALFWALFLAWPGALFPTAAQIASGTGRTTYALMAAATSMCYLAHFHGWSTYQPPAAMGADAAMCLGSWWWLVRVWADKTYEASH